MKDFTIIKMWLYHHRIIYLTKISEKYQLFYRSSGRAGYNSEGMVFPHLLLKEGSETSPDGFGAWNSVGWIPKCFMYDGRFAEYRYKLRHEFPENMHDYLDYLENYESEDITEEPNPKEINDFCRQFIKSKQDYIDWKGD